MSETNKSAPRWEDVPATDYDAEARAWVVGYLTSLRDDEAAEVAWRRADDNGTYVEATARMHEANLRWLDAALARLAEPAQSSTPAAPAQPSAAERWRAVPERIRRETLARLERHADEWAAPRAVDAEDAAHRAAAGRALLALAREAEGT